LNDQNTYYFLFQTVLNTNKNFLKKFRFSCL
jgi:hypothetical protein